MNKAANIGRSRWLRAPLSLLVSGGLLSILFSRLDLEVLRQSIANVHLSVLWIAMLMYGLFLFIGSIRWRIALNESSLQVPFVVMLRASMVGHVFNMAFFGPVGGDLAKTAAYARWHKYEIHDLLATAAIDRSFSVLGSVLLFLFTLLLLFTSPTLSEFTLVPEGEDQNRYLLLGLLAALIITLVGLHLRRRPFFAQLFSAFAAIARALHRAPLKLMAGCFLGFAGQLLSSFILLVGLVAVTYPEGACTGALWAYPLIAAIAALPFSVGGAGLRESAALLFLGDCGAAPEQVVVAGLLVLLTYVLWGVIGIPVLLWEEYHYGKSEPAAA